MNQGECSPRLKQEAKSLRETILPDLEKLLNLATRMSGKFKIYGQPPMRYIEMIRRSRSKSSALAVCGVFPVVC